MIQSTYAQDRTITGNVTSFIDGLPLPGANVLVQGTTTGTQTDFDGNYAINASSGNVLVFSYVGMKDQQISVGSSNTINAVMQEDVSALEEVVVVAYGTQTKESIVGSVVTVGEDLIDRTQSTTVTAALQGNVPGVNIITTGGVPGTEPTIRIRGVGSINASASPLIVVDGAPYNGNLNSLSQDQIATMSVLKDASSTSLYGSRAANGVIVITTKSGKKNQSAKFEINSSYGITDNAVDFMPLLQSEDWMKLSWEASRNSNLYISGQDAASAAQDATNGLVPLLGYNPYNVDNPIGVNGQPVPGASLMWDTDWLEVLLRPTGSRQEHSASLSGGSENSTYFFSVNYLDQQGNIKTTVFERLSARMKMESQVTDWFKVGLNTSFTTSRSNTPSQSGTSFANAQQWAYTVAPVYPVYRRDENGNLILDGTGNTIYDYGQVDTPQSVNGTRPIFGGENGRGTYDNYSLKRNRQNTTLAGFAEVQFTDWLKFRSTLSYESYIFDRYDYISSEVGYASGDATKGRVRQDRDFTKTLNGVQALNFNKTFGSHTFNFDAIYEAYQFEYSLLSAQGIGFLPGVKVLDGSTTPESVSGSLNQERLTSYLGRLSYNFNNRYYIEGSYRRDSSTRFDESVRDGDFYSVGGSWIASKEKFLENSDVLTYLKFKGSYGELGNNSILNSDATAQEYFPYFAGYQTGWPQLGNIGVLLGGAVDPLLTWEKTASQNYGVEFQLFDRLDINVDYYTRESVDLIYNKPLPPSTGTEEILTNVGAIKNFGWEFTVGANIISNQDFQWDAGFNFSLDENEITELTQESFINGSKRWEVGRSLYDFYINEWAGVDPADGYGMWYVDIEDAEGNVTGRETTKDYDDATDYYFDGKSSLPDIVGGFNTSLRYKNWDFNVNVNFSFGAYILNGEYQGLMHSFESPGRAAHSDLLNRWQQPGDITDVPLLLASNNDFNARSSRFLEKNDYVRVKALNFGYNLDSDVAESIGLSAMRLYVQGDNLFTFATLEGLDPEQNIAGTTNSRSYQTKTFTFGVNVSF
jgi:TonB-linked SusC/RagA family outer membrane protein